MAHAVCPWWLGPLLASPLRRLWQDPRPLLAPYVKPGDMVLEPGPGMGFFTRELARLVGPEGRVVAVDLQPRMIEGLKRRLGKAGLLDRVDARVAADLDFPDLAGRVDVLLAAAVVHELPDAGRFFAEAARAVRPGGTLLVGEPRGEVGAEAFERTVALAGGAGFRLIDRPPARSTRTARFVRDGDVREEPA